MKTSQTLFANYELPTKGPDHKEAYRELEARLTEYYGKNMYWVCHMYSRIKIEQAFYQMQKKDDREVSHLIQTAKEM